MSDRDGRVHRARERVEGMPKTIGLCPVCKDDFYMPDAKEGDGCPYNHAAGFDDHDERLVVYVPMPEHCRCIYTAHCHRGEGCKLRAGGTVNAGSGVCVPRHAEVRPSPEHSPEEDR